MKLHSLSEHEIVEVVATGDDSEVDPRGRPIFSARDETGRSIQVMAALDPPDLVIAISCEVGDES